MDWDAEQQFYEEVLQLLQREFIFDCEQRGLPADAAARLILQVAQNLLTDETTDRLTPESRFERKMQVARGALRSAGQALDGLQRDMARFKRNVARGNIPPSAKQRYARETNSPPGEP